MDDLPVLVHTQSTNLLVDSASLNPSTKHEISGAVGKVFLVFRFAGLPSSFQRIQSDCKNVRTI